jgi:hypothetical protein
MAGRIACTVAAAAVAVMVAGCGRGASSERTTSTARPPPPTASTTPADQRPPSLRTACGTTEGLSATPLWLRTADGVRLYAVEAGTGSAVIVLAHEGRDDLCGSWLPYAARLVRSGFRTLMFDFRGNGQSDSVADPKALRLDRDLEAAVTRAWARGTQLAGQPGVDLFGHDPRRGQAA